MTGEEHYMAGGRPTGSPFRRRWSLSRAWETSGGVPSIGRSAQSWVGLGVYADRLYRGADVPLADRSRPGQERRGCRAPKL